MAVRHFGFSKYSSRQQKRLTQEKAERQDRQRLNQKEKEVKKGKILKDRKTERHFQLRTLGED